MNHLECAINNPSKNQLWKYIANIIISLAAANTIGSLPLVAVILYNVFVNKATPDFDNPMNFGAYGISQNLGLFLMLLAFVVALISLIFFLKPFHNRTFKEVINGTNRIRWNHFAMGMIVWTIIMAIGLVIDYNMDPDIYVLQFDIYKFIPLVLITLTLIPIQTAYEEVAFRGYLAQGIAAKTKSRWWVIIIPSVLFGLMHILNPEIKEHGFLIMMPQYIYFGLFFGIITVLDDGVELAIGVHAANNMFACLFTTNSSSALQTPAVFNVMEVNPIGSGISLVVFSLIAIAIFYKKYKWDFSILNRKIEKEPDTNDNEGQRMETIG